MHVYIHTHAPKIQPNPTNPLCRKQLGLTITHVLEVEDKPE